MYLETGSKGRKDAKEPYRRCFSSKRDAIADINAWKWSGDVYITVYEFRDSEQNGRWRPVYESAIVNKMFFDFDVLRPNGKGGEVFYFEERESATKLDDWLEKKNYAREIFFSGGGFHILPRAVGASKNLLKASYAIVDELNLQVDKSPLGDLARVRRFPNSLNWSKEGKKRSLYCIPLTREELDLHFEKIMQLAQEPRHKAHFKYGNFPIQIDDYGSFKIPHNKFEIIPRHCLSEILTNRTAEEILKGTGFSLKDFCRPMQDVIACGEMPKVGTYNSRWNLIIYCKSIIGLKQETCIDFLRAVLKPEVFEHSLNEQQFQLAYKRNRQFHPEKLRYLGICPDSCNNCEQIWRMRRNLGPVTNTK